MNYKVLLLYRKLYGGRKRNKCNGKKILLLQMLAAGLDESQGFLFYEKKFNYNGKRFRFEQPITRLVNVRLCLWFVAYKKKRKSPDISGFSSYKKASSFLFTYGGDNKTRTYDLYDVNVAL